MAVDIKRVAFIALAAGLSACSHDSSGTPRRQVTVHTALAVIRPVPRLVTAVGDVGPGFSPVIGAPMAGRLTRLRVTVDQSVAAGAPLAYVRPQGPGAQLAPIVAPAPGVITQILVPAGTKVHQGQALFGWTGATVRQARVPFPATLGPDLHAGQAVLLHSPLAPRSPVTGTIARLIPHPKHHAIFAVIALPPRHGWVVGSPVRADVVIADRPALVLPKTSIALRRAGDVVFVLHHRIVRMQAVTVAARLRRVVVISSGLAPGVTVVTDPSQSLINGTRVKISGRH